MDELEQFVLDFVGNAGGETTYPALHAAVNASTLSTRGLYETLVRLEARSQLHMQVERVAGQLRPVNFVRSGARPEEA